MIYNQTKHEELVAERANIFAVRNDLAIKLNEGWESKDDSKWDKQDLINFGMESKRVEFMDIQVKAFDHEISLYENLIPRADTPEDSPILNQHRALRQFLRHADPSVQQNDKDENLYRDHVNEEGRFVIKSPYATSFDEVEGRPGVYMASRSDIDSGTGSRSGLKKGAPEHWMDDPVYQLAFMGDVAKMCTSFMTPDGNKLHVVNIGGVADKGEIYAAQGDTISDQDIPDLTSIQFSAWDSSSKKMGIHRSAVGDVPTIRGGMLIENMGIERLARVWNDQFVNGTTGSTTQSMNGSAKVFTSSTTLVIKYEDLLGCTYNIDRAYRTGSEMIGPGGFRDPERGQVGWLMHDNFELAIRSLKASSRPLWTPGIAEGSFGMVGSVPPRLLGYPFGVTNDLDDDLAVGATPAMFGNFAYFGIRTVEDVTVERFYDSNSTPNYIYLVWARRDARFMGAFDSTPKCEAITVFTGK